MNLNKRGGFDSCDEKVLKEYTERYGLFIAKEIALIDPEVIICCGSGVGALVEDTVNQWKEVAHINCKIIIRVPHPRARNSYHNKLMKMKENVNYSVIESPSS